MAPLRPGDARQAYALVRLAYPQVALRDWLAFARRAARQSPRRGGLVALRDARGYVHALFSYQVAVDLEGGPVLTLANLIVGRLPGPLLDDAVQTAADGLARSLGCRSIVVSVAENGPAEEMAAFARRGFSPLARRLLERPAAPTRDEAQQC
ncbi:hypothetical protein QNA08_07280 [Chelatococcus sp. SYSU_G07232]|uniref:GNAT family N-acetyltransferase n=1 Tax=Chelatococcus albus TaxID=3047466 RepID=A0ABT7AGR7_9HYPH|nr:hypothetical protein [Chelatococcus sp. SYSU_G07232]MDJ1158034.1 hypothetical protein [Chelatococcus sp. SYSU_G07232]